MEFYLDLKYILILMKFHPLHINSLSEVFFYQYLIDSIFLCHISSNFMTLAIDIFKVILHNLENPFLALATNSIFLFILYLKILSVQFMNL